MLIISVFDFSIIVPNVITTLMGWAFFFKINQAPVLIKPQATDLRKSKTNVLKKVHFSIFLKFMLVLFFSFIAIFVTQHNCCTTFFFDHLLIDSIFLKTIFFFYLISILVIYIAYLLAFNKLSVNFDYFFAIFNLVAIVPLIYLSNTFFTFFFFLELSSCLIFYKFITARFFYKTFFNNFKVFEKFNRHLPKNFLNILFFQYWVTFFSSIFILFFLIQLLEYFGSSEWVFLNFLNLVLNNLKLANNFFLYVIFSIFTVSFFFKIGITPVHLFKIEVYKGLPFFSVFFYTVFYFFLYFFFFVVLTTTHLFSFNNYLWLILSVLLSIGVIYMVSMLFDVNLLKAFFAYSTIINSLVFLTILVNVLI